MLHRFPFRPIPFYQYAHFLRMEDGLNTHNSTIHVTSTIMYPNTPTLKYPIDDIT